MNKCILGTSMLAIGLVGGYKLHEKLLIAMVKDREFMKKVIERDIEPIFVSHFGEAKVNKIIEILGEKENEL